jgi:hypothetical protein
MSLTYHVGSRTTSLRLSSKEIRVDHTGDYIQKGKILFFLKRYRQGEVVMNNGKATRSKLPLDCIWVLGFQSCKV